ncbi:hypothetical protein B0H11DRAFT_1902554 [Mycena galericulata]|nr:hypothetical protein B0H11DRAFT_1902554 [Mycena galericulata]
MSDAFTWISPEGFDLARRIIRSTPVPYVPHDHQLEGVCKSLDGIDLFAITPTGSGKTSYYILYILIVLAVVNDPTLCPSAAFPQNPCLMMGFVHARMTGSHNPWILTSATVRDGAPFDNICKLLGLNNANFHLISFPELDWMLTSGRPSIIYAPDYGLGSRVYAYLCGISKSNNPNQIRMYNSLNFESHNAETRELLTGAPGEADSCQIVIGTDSLSVGVGMPARLDCVILYGDARHVKDADDFFQKLGRVGRTKGGSQRARGIIFVSAAARKLAQQTLDNYAAGILKDGENPPDLSMPTLIVAFGCLPENIEPPQRPKRISRVNTNIKKSKRLSKIQKFHGVERLIQLRLEIWRNSDQTKLWMYPPTVFLSDILIASILDNFVLLDTLERVAAFVGHNPYLAGHAGRIFQVLQDELKPQFVAIAAARKAENKAARSKAREPTEEDEDEDEGDGEDATMAEACASGLRRNSSHRQLAADPAIFSSSRKANSNKSESKVSKY